MVSISNGSSVFSRLKLAPPKWDWSGRGSGIMEFTPLSAPILVGILLIQPNRSSGSKTRIWMHAINNPTITAVWCQQWTCMICVESTTTLCFFSWVSSDHWNDTCPGHRCSEAIPGTSQSFLHSLFIIDLSKGDKKWRGNDVNEKRMQKSKIIKSPITRKMINYTFSILFGSTGSTAKSVAFQSVFLVAQSLDHFGKLTGAVGKVTVSCANVGARRFLRNVWRFPMAFQISLIFSI